MEEHYESKYKQIFEKDSNCTVLNDPQFSGPVTFNAGGEKSSLPPNDQKVKQAIEELYAENILTNDVQWYAIKQVLVYKKVTSQKLEEFTAYIERLNLNIPITYKNDNARRVPTKCPRLSVVVTSWSDIQKPTDAESRQINIANRLLEELS